MAKKRFPPGAFCWIELGTTDVDAARNFYTDVIGWGVKEVDMPGGMGTYMLFQLEGNDMAGMYPLSDDQTEQGVPPHWLSYIAVESADESANKAKGLGGRLLMEPFDVPGVGRMAMLADPTGANLALFEAGEHPGATPMDNRPGTFCWNELATKDPDAARSFYQGLTGWSSEDQDMGPMGTYTTFRNGERMAAGMVRIQKEWGPVPPHWGLYFAVSDCDGTVAKATKKGAEVRLPPSDVPEVGRMAQMTDPQGAAFSVIKLVNPEPN